MNRPILICVLLITSSILGQAFGPEATVQQKFASGGTVYLHLESGGYKVTPTDAENIVVTYSTHTEKRLAQVKVEIKPDSSRADVYVLNTPNNHFDAIIEIPRRSNLWARLTAGELVVGGIEGNKDLELNAGRLEVDIARPQDYGSRDISVSSGSIESSAFDISKGGLFRSIHQQGPGKYRLYAHVLAGEIYLPGSI